uniref:Ig-like domain-containing protein n=1 Tax=Oreochromis aureus TaxID=47969 RepID=A0AAZ1Y674_OREAU
AFVPVTTAQLGGPITFTCVLPKTETGRRDIHWYKQSPGDTLKIIWTLKESATPRFAPEFDKSRWKANYDKNVSNLTILRTNQEDEGIYHCGFTESETEKSCAYRFSKNVSSSDAGTYYCAVATCGEILYGKGTKLDIQGCSVWSQSASTVIFLLCPVLVLIVIAVLAYTIKKTNSDHCKGNWSYSGF